jgi:hypothetical protein
MLQTVLSHVGRVPVASKALLHVLLHVGTRHALFSRTFWSPILDDVLFCERPARPLAVERLWTMGAVPHAAPRPRSWWALLHRWQNLLWKVVTEHMKDCLTGRPPRCWNDFYEEQENGQLPATKYGSIVFWERVLLGAEVLVNVTGRAEDMMAVVTALEEPYAFKPVLVCDRSDGLFAACYDLMARWGPARRAWVEAVYRSRMHGCGCSSALLK